MPLDSYGHLSWTESGKAKQRRSFWSLVEILQKVRTDLRASAYCPSELPIQDNPFRDTGKVLREYRRGRELK